MRRTDAAAVVARHLFLLRRLVKFGMSLEKPGIHLVSALVSQKVHFWNQPHVGRVARGLDRLRVRKRDRIGHHALGMRGELVAVAHEQYERVHSRRLERVLDEGAEPSHIFRHGRRNDHPSAFPSTGRRRRNARHVLIRRDRTECGAKNECDECDCLIANYFSFRHVNLLI